MAKTKDNEVTINQVRAIAEQIVRDRNVTIVEATTRDVKDILKRGSDGYIGAHLQTVKIEYARAKLLEEKDISPHYNAALYDEIKRHTGNAREIALAEAAVTQEMFDEVCELNIELENQLDQDKKELAQIQTAFIEKEKELEDVLRDAGTGKTANDNLLRDALSKADKSENNLSEALKELTTAREELVATTTKHELAEEERVKLLEAHIELNERLQKLIEDKAKAEQKVESLSLANKSLEKKGLDQDKRYEKAVERAARAEALLEAQTNEGASS
ncbi:MAG: hypothetical protein OET55_00075 [Desulfuromonadales bacterium]|nr:hypothetical protein [Desulfuromonadales bacterium]MDH3867752.1 hypothetical protein [Desulfuromonadales bacterium]MDH3959651.1 hypothetical protein [Desulfuromonadales bacterium]MDH4024404.1 hypothetical protein [Desulfuromonadales bacterium]